MFAAARKSGHKGRAPRASADQAPQIAKIRAMLAADGLPDSYAEGILRRIFKHEHRVPLTWAKPPELGKVIAALEYRRRRLEKRAAAAGGRQGSRKRGTGND